MVAYVLAGNATLRDIGNAAIWGVATARAGGDTVDTNGFSLTIDQDTRYGLSGTTSTSLGSLTVNATKGGSINIDGRYVRMIPFTGGSGTITAGTLITCGSATGKVIGIYSAITAAPVLTGVATGWIKVAAWNGIAFPTSGTFTQAGYTFTISGADKVGFIDVVGDEAATINANRLGTVNILGDWYEVGTASGSNATTYQLPTNGAVTYHGAVWVETGVGTGVYEPYPCAGTLVAASSTPTDAIRGKVCWISTAGVLRFGSDGTNTVGYVPASGIKIRLPNVFLNNCTTAARTANVLPNATLASRYDFTTTGGGVVNMQVASCNWYPSFAQAFSVSLIDVGIATQLLISELASPLVATRVCVGQEAANAQFGLSMALCFAGGTFTDCNFTSATLAASGRYILSLTDVSDFTFLNCKTSSRVFRGNATSGAAILTRMADCVWTNCTIGLGMLSHVTCTNVTYTGTVYYDNLTTTGTSMPMSVWVLASNCSNIKMDGLTFGGLTNVHPYTAIMSINAAGCSNIKLRNIGTYASRLSLGSASATGLVYVLAAGAAASDVKVQRVYVANTRTGIMSGDNSSTRVLQESVFGDYADASDLAAVLNYQRKGIGGTLAVTAQTAIYGTHWYDCFTSATAGRIGLSMNEATSLSTAQVTLSNGAAFTSAGGLYMPVIGHTAVFETPNYILGHTAFPNTSGTMSGGTVGNYTFRFQIDKNDGNGYSAWSSTTTVASLAIALNAITGIDAQLGFKLKLEIVTSTTNATAITSFYIPTTSTTTAQAYQYPLDTITLTLTGLVTGSDVTILESGTENVLVNQEDNVGTTYSYTYATPSTVDISIYLPGYMPSYVRSYALSSSNASLPVSQTPDPSYLV